MIRVKELEWEHVTPGVIFADGYLITSPKKWNYELRWHDGHMALKLSTHGDCASAKKFANQHREQRILSTLKPEGEQISGEHRPPFEFDRYINGVLMAEGVTIEQQSNLVDAVRVAARIASKGPNREAPVLVYRPPSEQISVEPALHGPYGWLNGHRALNEESWTLESDPLENSEEYFAIPLYSLIDPFKEIGKDYSPSSEQISGENAWQRVGSDPELANARRKLSIHEIRLIIKHAQHGMVSNAVYESAVKGRQEFRDAYRSARSNATEQISGEAVERGKIVYKIIVEERPDGGVRVWCDELPGLILSGKDPSKVLADISPAIKMLREFKP